MSAAAMNAAAMNAATVNAPPAPAPAVSVTDLGFSYAGPAVLDGLSFDVAAGEIFGVLGADGCGKSTLLRLLIGQLRPGAGRITILGEPAGTPSVRERVAYMPQSFGQYMDLSVRENLEFFAALHGLRGEASAKLVADLVARAGLRGFESRRAGQLSGGMMQKLALACALVSRPRAMFLDEPTTGVDPVSRRAFWQLLEAVRADGVCIVLATSNMEEGERCDRVATLERGRFVREGRPLEVVRRTAARLFAARGPRMRMWAGELAAMPQVELAFPVGPQVKLWLREVVAPESFARELSARGLELVALAPGLHDVALRELALSRADAAHG